MNHAGVLKQQRRWLLLLVVFVALTPFASINLGSAAVPFHTVWAIVLNHLPGVDFPQTWSDATEAIVWLTRMPRIIAGLGIGAVLGVSGVVLQALVRNPLAEPYVLGVSAGASSGAAAMIVLIGSTSLWAMNGLAFLGALLATALILLLAGQANSLPLHLILAGLAVSFGFQALTNLLIFYSGSPETSRAVMFWMLGSLGRANWHMSLIVLATGIMLTIVSAILGPILDALASGDRTAQSVGVEPTVARVLILIPVSAAVAIAVAAAGGIGFVGLIIPHIMRFLLGHSHRYLVLGSALAAGLFLVWADTVARVVFAPAEIPIGVVTALVGCPFLVLLLKRSQTLG